MTVCPHPDCGSPVTPGGFCQRTGRYVDVTAGRHAFTVEGAPGPVPPPRAAAATAARVLPPPQDDDPLALPEVRPVAFPARPADLEGLRGLGLGPDRTLAASTG